MKTLEFKDLTPDQKRYIEFVFILCKSHVTIDIPHLGYLVNKAGDIDIYHDSTTFIETFSIQDAIRSQSNFVKEICFVATRLNLILAPF